ncbi:Nrap protein [Vararia minispora EC-137]|uniref:Nrap protein n=1 Tax=Vararia minispora EC-137 TaxID=1314806 RepID=A0ACB8QE40_9AGAM|nr:Nrap protein [Vararia minispora EC-137]
MALNLKRKRRPAPDSVFPNKKRQLVPPEDDEFRSALDENEFTHDQEEDEDEGWSEEDPVAGDGMNELDEREDGEAWEGIGKGGARRGLSQASHNGATKNPPTGQEVRVIKQAADLFRSSSFKLQIDALLPNVRPKESRRAALDSFLLSLHSVISAAPSIPPQHPLEAARSLLSPASDSASKRERSNGKVKVKDESSAPSVAIAVPYAFPAPPEDANWKVSFEKPSEITLVGSWANKVGVKAKDNKPWIVDIAVEMPSGLFQEKDYMNGRFFHKRAFYLAALTKHIVRSESGLGVEAFYQSHGSDPRLTTLLLRPTADEQLVKSNAQVRIIPTLSSQSPIPLSKLSPHRSNFRVGRALSSESTPTIAIDTPTPLYNSILLLATTPREHLLAVHSMKQDFPAYGDALALLRVWANQRGYGEGTAPCVRGFDGRGAWWNSLLELLILGEEPVRNAKTSRKPLGKGLSSYQLFRSALDFLARQDLANEPTFVKSKDGHRFSPQDYAEYAGPVFVDSTSSANLLSGMPRSSLGMLRHDARVTLDILNSTDLTNDPFHEIFLKDHRSLATRFDAVIRVDLSGSKMRNPSAHEAVEYGSPSNAVLASMSTYLQRALGSRVHAFALLHTPPSSRPITQAQPDSLADIYIGLVYDPEHAWRLVDHGPSASDVDNAEVAAFHELWGSKAELRRFKDGSIMESVVWDVKNADERARIPLLVVEHVLAIHFSLPRSALHSWQAGFDEVVRLPPSIVSIHTAAGHQAGFKAAMAAFDDLVKTLKSLDEDLPLSILSVSPTSEYLRHTSVFNPIAMPISAVSSFPICARFTPIMEAVLEFEKSARWPDDLRAIQKMKLAFFERIASALMGAVRGLTARIAVLEAPQDSAIEDHACLELVTPLGWAFALRIWHAREETLLTRAIDAVAQIPKQFQQDHAEKFRERDAATSALALYTRRFIHAPRHHRAVAAFGYRFPAYGGTVRLIKRWLASHWLLRGHISEEAVEILCAAVFARARDAGGALDPTRGAPGSRERGFACVVELLKDWKWERGLFVPLYGEDGSPPAVTIVAGAAGVWTLSTEFDKEGKMWTACGPDIVAAQRVRVLARATWECMKKAEVGALDVKSLFVHPTDDYDFVVQLEQATLPRYFQNIVADPVVWARRSKYANMAQDPSEKNVVVRPGFDPAQMFIDDLRVRLFSATAIPLPKVLEMMLTGCQSVYSDTLKIFYDPLGGDRFGAVWEPSVRQPRPFRVLNHFSSAPVMRKDGEKGRERGVVVVNEAAILDEIIRLGHGLVIV